MFLEPMMSSPLVIHYDTKSCYKTLTVSLANLKRDFMTYTKKMDKRFVFCFTVLTSAYAVSSFSSDQPHVTTPTHVIDQLKKCQINSYKEMHQAKAATSQCMKQVFPIFVSPFQETANMERERSVEITLQRVCRNSEKFLKCMKPIENAHILCFEDESSVLKLIQDFMAGLNGTMDKLCKDNEGKTFAKLSVDSDQLECIKNVYTISTSECNFDDFLKTPYWDEHSCRQVENLLGCADNFLRRKCDTFELLDYSRNLMYAFLEAGSCKPYLSGPSNYKFWQATQIPNQKVILHARNSKKTSNHSIDHVYVIYSKSTATSSSSLLTVISIIGFLIVHKFQYLLC